MNPFIPDISSPCIPSTHFMRIPRLTSIFQCVLVLIFLPSSLRATPLGYQQMTTASASGGYQHHQDFFLDQQGLLSRGPSQFSYRVQCQSDHCDWQSAKLSYLPLTYQLEIGYDKRFQSHVLSRQQPFFGMVASYPNMWAQNPQHMPSWRPWLGLIMPRSGMMQLKDPTGTLQQNTLTSGSHLIDAYDLPRGAYPIDLSLTDQTGHTETVQQFVNNTDISQIQPKKSTRLTIGMPTDQAASSAYGLPPIDTHLRALMVNLTHRFHSQYGTTQATVNLQKQQLALGLNNVFLIGKTYWQPELLWLHGISSTVDRQSMAIGFNAQGLINSHTQWRFLSTTYPKKQASQHLPWIAHGQFQWLYDSWLAGVTGHYSDQQNKRYLQALVRAHFQHMRLHPIVSLSTRVFEQGLPTFSLMITAKEKTPVAWSSKFTNTQQSITAAIHPMPKSKLAVSAIHASTESAHQQRLAVTADWQTLFARWRATRSLPIDGHHATWSIRAKTGMICSAHASFWAPLSSIHTPAVVRMNTPTTHHTLYWGDRDALCQSGITLHKKKPYTRLSQKNAHDDLTLFPGNVYVTTHAVPVS